MGISKYVEHLIPNNYIRALVGLVDNAVINSSEDNLRWEHSNHQTVLKDSDLRDYVVRQLPASPRCLRTNQEVELFYSLAEIYRRYRYKGCSVRCNHIPIRSMPAPQHLTNRIAPVEIQAQPPYISSSDLSIMPISRCQKAYHKCLKGA
jgi:hypothetical protein